MNKKCKTSRIMLMKFRGRSALITTDGTPERNIDISVKYLKLKPNQALRIVFNRGKGLMPGPALVF